MPESPLLYDTPDIAPKVRIEFPFAPDYDGVSFTNITWTQERNRHDLMEIRLYGVNAERMLPHIPGGSPITVTIKVSHGKKTFYGYIHKAEPELDATAKAICLYVVSAGYPMKSASKLALGNTTASMAVSRIARKYKLFADIEPHPRKFRQLVQSGETDWEFLTRIADETGFSLRVEGATLRFVSRAALVKHYRSLSPTLRYIKGRGARLVELLDFRPLDGAYLDESSGVRVRRKLDYLDKYAKKFSSSSQDKPKDVGRTGRDPEYTRFTGATAKTFKEATLAASAVMEANRYPVVARAEIVGNPIINPDVMVYLEGVPRKYRGYWTVMKATHYIQPTRYTMDADLGLEEAAGSKSPGARQKSRYRLKTPYPKPRLQVRGARSSRRSVDIPKFFVDGPRWVGKR